MNREQLLNCFKESIDRNFVEREKYFDFTLEVFSELNTLLFEINKCLILELDRAAITLTNHLIEQLLKLALIKNFTGIDPIPIDQWDDIFSKANEKFGSLNFASTIDQCKKENLIDATEKAILYDRIREIMRNGFSHSEFSKILSELNDDDVKTWSFNINNLRDIKEVKFNQKTIPAFQALHAENFAKVAAKLYFDFIFRLIFKIENRLTEKYK